jgi:pimeloyl-ACP methyl ester carboxylesterase
MVACIHGISRDAEEQVRLLAPFADRHGFGLLAPVFEAEVWSDYQRLGRRGRGPRADLALQALLAECSPSGLREEGGELLIGFSGGAQFVHRYAMAHARRVRAAVVASAGWYTLPDSDRAYPQGLRVAGDLAGVRFELRALLAVAMRVFVGGADVDRDESLRRSRAIDRRQGRHRVERAERFVRAMERAARKAGVDPRIRLDRLRHAGHSFEACVDAGLGERAFRFLAEAQAGGARA